MASIRYRAGRFIVLWVAIAGAGALACVLAAGTSAAPVQPAGPPVISAMNGFSAMQLPPLELGQQLNAMRANGVQEVRSDAAWATIQPNPPGPNGSGWQWSQTDAWVSALATHHLTWEPIIDYAVGWAKTCPGFCAPSSDGPYATFAQAVASRYGVHGTFWAQNPQLPYLPVQIFEIWNEENDSAFYVSPGRYARLYAAARTAIHSVDRAATVIVGGLADDSGLFNAGQDYAAWYVLAMLVSDPGLKGSIDGFGLHPYGATAFDVERWISDFRHALTVWGEGAAPIYITEVGWTTGDQTREDWRAAQMSSLAAALAKSSCGIRMVAPYDWINPLTANESGDFGLVDRTGVDTVLRPSGRAWFTGLTRTESPSALVCGNGRGTSHGPPSLTPHRRHRRRRGRWHRRGIQHRRASDHRARRGYQL